ncbi:hypothetical protein Syun_030717 [Stephania yunnanensis]|uniref:Uncharacterized protein n=1 Tax=Stephania yunnanensis TaxID=152371 RepID=A0AAP0DVI5_9MAGN
MAFSQEIAVKFQLLQRTTEDTTFRIVAHADALIREGVDGRLILSRRRIVFAIL